MAANCSDNSIQCLISGQIDVLANIANNMPAVQRLITGAAYLMGLMFFIKAIMTLKEFGESRTMMSSSKNIKEPLLYFIVGSMLLYLPTGVAVLMQSTFGYSNILAYAPLTTGNSSLNTLFGPNSGIGQSLAIIIRTIGLIAFIRGWVLVARSASGGQAPGGMGKGMVHVFGGILAMNIVGTLNVINNTLYGG